jgi:hypothetical protein
VSDAAALTAGGALLAAAVLLGTVLNRVVPRGGPRRTLEEAALILGFASPALGLTGPYLRHHLWAPAAVVAAGYGGFYLVRIRQLRRADRDRIRGLLGLHRDATFGEVWREVERIEPRTLTNGGRLVIGIAAAAILAAGALLHRYDAAVIGLLLGAAESTLRPAYHRRLADRVRDIAH